ncbi:unnamed protein product [Protopolystoma xenopodis]|uniref:Secreted protein n=1 Tax=Protopolystoma xenopodis TaxID=117903 RepID=A0A3S5FCW4_9PLAT|nr:unnamed protein product [Protopolystoma xenopodis]
MLLTCFWLVGFLRQCSGFGTSVRKPRFCSVLFCGNLATCRRHVYLQAKDEMSQLPLVRLTRRQPPTWSRLPRRVWTLHSFSSPNPRLNLFPCPPASCFDYPRRDDGLFSAACLIRPVQPSNCCPGTLARAKGHAIYGREAEANATLRILPQTAEGRCRVLCEKVPICGIKGGA